MKSILKVGLLTLIAAVLFGTLWGLGNTPRNDRNWKDYLAHTPHVEEGADSFSITPVNDWSYQPSGPTDRPEIMFTARFADLKNVWFAVEPSPYSGLVAHTFMLFEFTDDRIVGLSIEARQEQNEDYSPWKGLYNSYELLFSWVTARDSLERRAVYLDHHVFVYPLELSPAHGRSLLHAFLDETAKLETKPRFYNTLFHNCTNELAKEMGFSWNPAFVLTGKSVGYFYKRGLIPASSLEIAKQRADMTDWLVAENGQDKSAFNAALLAELRARVAGSSSVAAR